MTTRPLPSVLLGFGGYTLNIPAEWQTSRGPWWREPGMAQALLNERAARGIQLQDAAWAYAAGEPEPSPDADSYTFDYATQRYLRK